jgi:hypothetical protein
MHVVIIDFENQQLIALHIKIIIYQSVYNFPFEDSISARRVWR